MFVIDIPTAISIVSSTLLLIFIIVVVVKLIKINSKKSKK